MERGDQARPALREAAAGFSSAVPTPSRLPRGRGLASPEGLYNYAHPRMQSVHASTGRRTHSATAPSRLPDAPRHSAVHHALA